MFRYPALHEVTRSLIGIPASARANVAAFMQADLVPDKKIYIKTTYVIYQMFEMTNQSFCLTSICLKNLDKNVNLGTRH